MQRPDADDCLLTLSSLTARLRCMFRPVPLILILAVMLSSIGLGAARGTVRMGDQIVLCTGHGVVVVERPDGQGDTVRLCPDMALTFMAAIGSADVILPQRFGVPRLLSLDASPGAAPWAQAWVRARDPPVGLRA